MGSQSIWFPRPLSSLRLSSVLTNRQMEGEGEKSQMEGEGEKISNGVKTDEFRSSKLAPNCFDNMWQKNLNTQPSCSSGTIILKDLMGNHPNCVALENMTKKLKNSCLKWHMQVWGSQDTQPQNYLRVSNPLNCQCSQTSGS